jgi:hypothetical protein
MELLSPRAKRALDRLTEIASGNQSLVFDALSRLERGDDDRIRNVGDVIAFLKAGGHPERPADPQPSVPSASPKR